MYDSANQLIRENNQKLGKTWTWSYDSAGNILCKREYNYTTGALLDTVNYTYGDASWGDLLTGYDGRTITYDEIGNPLNDGRRTYTWERGRRVASINGAAMCYDSDGMLIEQYAGDDWYGYTYRDGRLVRLDMFVENGDYTFIIEYDASGAPMSLKCSLWNSDSNTSTTTTYYYMVNAQGDVVGLVDSVGYPVVTYWYDAWGKEIDRVYSSGISQTDRDVADLNPLRYRGYIYDVESGLYYLQSRFYDPETGRFINADEFVSTGQDLQGYNMFAYCGNNPITRFDSNGRFWDYVVDAVFLVWDIVDVVNDPKDWKNWVGLGVDIVLGVIPFLTSGAGQLIKVGNKVDDFVDAAKAIDKADDAIDTLKAVDNIKVHGNSLSTPKETVGYALRKNDTHEIMKYGETTRGTKRYTNKFYKENGVYMDIMEHGSKYDMHYWQHEQIINYYKKYGHRPPWNKSFW